MLDPVKTILHRLSGLIGLIVLVGYIPITAAQGRNGQGLAQTLERAKKVANQGAYALALELYLKAIDLADEASAAQRRELINKTLATCKKLIGQNTVEPAVRGLVALLPITKGPAIGKKPHSLGARVRLALESLALDLVLGNKPKLALLALKALMADGPGDPMRWALMVRAYLESGDFKNAQDSLRRAISLYPKASELYFVRAALCGALSRKAVSQSNYLRAESLLRATAKNLEQAARREPKIAGIHRALGKIKSSLWVYYRATGQYTQAMNMLLAAEDAYADAAHLDPRNPEIPFELGNMLFVAQDWVYSGVWFEQALKRFQVLSKRKDLPESVRAALKRNIDRCFHNLASTLHNRALDASNIARFDLARELVGIAGRKVPAYAKESQQLHKWLTARQAAFDRQLKLLTGMNESGDAQVALGDLFMRARQFESARAAYQRAIQLPLNSYTLVQMRDKIFGTQVIESQAQKTKSQIGGIEVRLEIPKSFDSTTLAGLLQKAHSLTMGAFPHRLNGPLDLKIFTNRRAFLEQAGIRLGTNLGGFYSFGRVVTFDEPGRSRAKWLEILVHEISHRYVDEMSYAKAPRWLSEGLAQWVSQGWSRKDSQKLSSMVTKKQLTAWKDLDRRLSEHWNDAGMINKLYLQSRHMVHWLTEQFDFKRLTVLLASLRAGKPIEAAILEVYGLPIETLEQNWLFRMK